MSDPIRLGAFDLVEPIGRGGMGVVWRAVHRTQGLPVAIKVMSGDRANEERYKADFRAEVRAMAGLDHPGVVVVFDMGEVDEAAAASCRDLVPGSPWMAMEYAALGTLEDVPLPLPWARLRRVLLELLDALGHAHSRGIVHRDMKPANVLLGHRDDRVDPGHPGRAWDGTIRLADFGLAHVGEERSAAGLTDVGIAGTPHYMAPEQFSGHWRDYGPWTDLYALGCIAYQLAHGRMAFSGDSVFSLAWAHTLGERPPWEERQQLPEDFRAWVFRLLERQPNQRFRRAADAAWALARMEVPEDLWEPAAPLGGEHHSSVVAMPALGVTMQETSSCQPLAGPLARTAQWPDEETLAIPASSLGDAAARPLAPGGASDERHRAARPPIPASWRRPGGERTSMRLVGAGTGLYGLRTVPFTGRGASRDLLWGALRDVEQTGRPRALLLHGPAGTGKTRLASWLSLRAEELGAATTLCARHGEVPGPRDGLAPMLARHLRCSGLGGTELASRVEGLLRETGSDDGAERDALAALLSGGEAGGVRLAGPTERHAVVLAALRRLAAERLLIVTVDDVQWGADTLGFVHEMLAFGRAAPLPVLVVLTALDEALADRPAESELLDRLLRCDRTGRVEIGPLGDADRHALVGELLGFEGGLAARIDQRTAGNPLFLVQLVGDWVQRGVLVAGPSGFELGPGADDVLPSDLDQVGAARLERALRPFGPAGREAAELAAALGLHVDGGEWAQVCLDRDLAAPLGDLLERLLDARLALPADGGWSFAHGMLRESLARTAGEGGRWRDLNRTCAAMLAALDSDDPGLAGRIGWHHVAAGDLDAALAPLLLGARAHLERSDPRSALALLERRSEAVRLLGLDEADPRRIEGQILAAWAHRQLGDLDPAEAISDAAAAVAERHGRRVLQARALLIAAQVAHARGRFDASLDLHKRVRDLAEAEGLAREATQALQALADVAFRRGRVEEADARFRDAASRFASLARPVEEADCIRARALTARRMGRAEEAVALLGAAIGRYQAAGHRRGMADCVNSLAEIAREQGRLAEAEDGYRRAIALHEAVGVGGEAARVNLGLVLVARGAFLESGHVLEGALVRLRDSGRRAALGWAEAATLPSHAAAGHWDSFARALDRAGELLRETGTADRDMAWVCERAAGIAAEAGRRDLAVGALALSVEQWMGVGQPEQAERLGLAIASLRDQS